MGNGSVAKRGDVFVLAEPRRLSGGCAVNMPTGRKAFPAVTVSMT